MATKYGTVENNILILAPRAFMLHGAMVTNPKAEHFAALNAEREKEGKPPYLEEVDTPPQTDAAHYTVATGWERDGDTWKRVYEIRELPPPQPRAFDRYKVVTALKAKGVWRDVRNALLAEDEDALDMLFTAEDITEDEPLLDAMIAMLKAAPFNWTDEQVEAVLAASVKDGY